MSPHTTAELIADIESSGNAHALRFEPGTFYRSANTATPHILENIMLAHECNLSTARMIYSTSWGKYQMMGFNLYAPPENMNPIAGTVFDFVNDENSQDEFFNAWLEAKQINFSLDELRIRANALKFGEVYNGNAVAYANAIEKALTP